MSPRPPAPQRRRRGDIGASEAHADERWLLTYADMITLLMALFIVMWSISAVNKSKFEELKTSLHAAFSGKVFGQQKSVLTGENSILNSNGAPVQPPTTPTVTPTVAPTIAQKLAALDEQNLAHVKAQIDSFARKNRLAGRLETTIEQRGLVIRLLTDDLLFNPGEAALKPSAYPLVGAVARTIAHAVPNDVRVEGNTDNLPISTYQFQSNWELSAGRAAAVLQRLRADGVAPQRLSLAGYADQRPVASNATSDGRRRNRRVDLVVLRRDVTQGVFSHG